jgi:hypothetical protein
MVAAAEHADTGEITRTRYCNARTDRIRVELDGINANTGPGRPEFVARPPSGLAIDRETRRTDAPWPRFHKVTVSDSDASQAANGA